MPRIEMGKKYVTRNGRDATVLTVNGAGNYPVVYQTVGLDGDFPPALSVGTHIADENGRNQTISSLDLVEKATASHAQVMWAGVGMGTNTGCISVGGASDSREEALRYGRHHKRIGLIRLEYNGRKLTVTVED